MKRKICKVFVILLMCLITANNCYGYMNITPDAELDELSPFKEILPYLIFVVIPTSLITCFLLVIIAEIFKLEKLKKKATKFISVIGTMVMTFFVAGVLVSCFATAFGINEYVTLITTLVALIILLSAYISKKESLTEQILKINLVGIIIIIISWLTLIFLGVY